jgi:ABC-type arginine transport system permease subunit
MVWSIVITVLAFLYEWSGVFTVITILQTIGRGKPAIITMFLIYRSQSANSI